MSRSGGRDQEATLLKLFRKASEQTHPIIVLSVLLLLTFGVLAAIFLYAGPIVGPLLLLAAVIVIALLLEAYEQAVARGWL